ncbi:peroxisomal membrane protein PEX13-like [Tubulanus polymorphus]|uniref:peroxisomal membrane protein PEX13-like n=1 Tax=Tubulanus polymorphus TaxID=672921 RepID=UPI003DA699E9
MASPVKPCCAQKANRNLPYQVRGLPNSITAAGRAATTIPPMINPNERLPPPIPNRQAHLNAASSGYGSYSPYAMGNFGMYGSGMGRMGYGYGAAAPINTFTRLAENSTRPAFESLEGIVNTFSSITMMLESTYFAVHSSFRAVVGLADHFSHLRHSLTDVWKNNIIRALKQIIRRLMVFLRLRNPVNESEEAWVDALNSGIAGNAGAGNKHGSSWPVFVFFLIVIGGPYLIWKLISSVINEKSGEPEQWMSGNEDHFVAMADYDFEAMNEDEISFKAGQEIIVAPKELQPRMKGWLLGSVDGQQQGLIPGNYVRVLGKRRGCKNRPVKPLPVKPNEQTLSNSVQSSNKTEQEIDSCQVMQSLEDVWIETETNDSDQNKTNSFDKTLENVKMDTVANDEKTDEIMSQIEEPQSTPHD